MKRRHLFHGLTLVVGVVALVFLVDHLGRDGLERVFLGTGWWFAVVAVIDFSSMLCDAAGVYCFVRPVAPIAYRRVVAAQASGIAINRLTPGNSLGEPVKVTMLMAHVPEFVAISAIVKFNLSTYLVATGSIAIGVPLTLLLLDLPGQITLLVLVVTAVMVAAVLGLVVLARRGALATIVGALRRVRVLSQARAERWTKRLADIDEHVKQYGDPATRRALIFVFASRALNMTGTVVTLVALGIELTPPLVIGTLSVGIIIQWISNVIPLGLGLADGGNYALYGALGSSPTAGLEFAMVNRVRTVVLASMGLAVMAIANLVDRRR